MKRMLYTPAAAARPLLNRVRHILGLKKESDRTCGGVAGLILLILLMLSPLCFAILQDETTKSVELKENADQSRDSNGAVAVEESLPVAVPLDNSRGSDYDGITTSFGMVEITPESGNSTPTNDVTYYALKVENTPNLGNSTLQTQNSTLPTPEPVTAKLYPMENALQLFDEGNFPHYLEERLIVMRTIEPSQRNLFRNQQVFPPRGNVMVSITKRNALLVTGTEDVHKEMQKIMAEIDEIVESEEFKASREMNAAEKPEIKVFKIKHTQAASLAAMLQNLQIDPEMLFSADMPTNSMLIKAKPETIKTVEELITQLDTEPVNKQPQPNASYAYGYSIPTQQQATPQPAQQYTRPVQPFSAIQVTPSNSPIDGTPQSNAPVAARASDSPISLSPSPSDSYSGTTPSGATYSPAPASSGVAVYGQPTTQKPGRPLVPQTRAVTRKVQEVTPEGETIEREVTEEVTVYTTSVSPMVNPTTPPKPEEPKAEPYR